MATGSTAAEKKEAQKAFFPHSTAIIKGRQGGLDIVLKSCGRILFTVVQEQYIPEVMLIYSTIHLLTTCCCNNVTAIISLIDTRKKSVFFFFIGS